MEQKRIKVRLTKNSPYSDYGYYEKVDIGYIDGYVNDNAVIIFENGKFAKADLRWIEVVNEEDKNVNTELKENEDERIRKEMISHFAKGIEGSSFDEVREKYKIWISWLEKQGEQKPAIKLEHDDNREPVLTPFEAELFSMMSEAWQGYSFGEEVNIAKIVKEHSIELLERANEQKSAEVRTTGYWNVQDIEQKPAWSEEDEDKFDILNIQIQYNLDVHEEDKRELLNWLKDFKDRVLLQSEKEWNEENEKIIIQIRDAVEDYFPTPVADKIKTWLKSLRPQNTWKPSDEQMERLKGIINSLPHQEVLYSLYQDLKKLKGE